MTDIAHPFAHPFYVMAKPVGPQCNLKCSYCYYLEKRRLFDRGPFRMSDALLQQFVRDYIEAQTSPNVLFTWHGGEPLLLPVSFYERALYWQQRYAGGRHIDNCIQTNGTLINDEWAAFFSRNRFLVGVSIDGPQSVHDALRPHSFDRVMRGITLLNRYGVEWNAMATVNSLNVGRPLEFYRFFKQIDCHYLQFTPIVERYWPATHRLLAADEQGGEMTETSISSQQWGTFLCAIFDEWVRHDVGTTFVQLFDATLANWAGVVPGICSLAPVCGQCAALEHNGDLYSCDHFVFPAYRLGNIRHQSITAMMYGERQRLFGQRKLSALTRQCRECPYLHLCHGECPKNRFVTDCYGQPGHNYLCDGYRQFFAHSAPAMAYMKAALDEGRAPSDVMQSGQA